MDIGVMPSTKSKSAIVGKAELFVGSLGVGASSPWKCGYKKIRRDKIKRQVAEKRRKIAARP
jgi:hypothetical protein